MSFGERVKARREELDLYQSDIAKRAGISQQTIARYELGSLPRRESIAPLARALELPTEEVMRWSLEEPESPQSEIKRLKAEIKQLRAELARRSRRPLKAVR